MPPSSDHKQGRAGRLNELHTTGLADGSELHLGARSLALNGQRAMFSCPMLAEPSDQVEFVWYLNSSSNERRLVFTETPAATLADDSIDVEAPQGGRNAARSGADFEAMRAGPAGLRAAGRRRPQVAVSRLLFGASSQADYGRLYCVARNAVGDQKRACFYTIEEPTAGAALDEPEGEHGALRKGDALARAPKPAASH